MANKTASESHSHIWGSQQGHKCILEVLTLQLHTSHLHHRDENNSNLQLRATIELKTEDFTLLMWLWWQIIVRVARFTNLINNV
jgi:hypothetical protein